MNELSQNLSLNSELALAFEIQPFKVACVFFFFNMLLFQSIRRPNGLMIELYLHIKFYLDYFPGRLKYAELGKSTRLTFSVPVPNLVEVIP